MKYMLRNIERKNDPAPWCDVKLAFDDNFAEMLLEHFPQPYSVDYTGARSCTNKFRKFVTRVETPDAQHKLFYTNEFRHNTGWMSFGGSPLIHGVEKNAQVDGARRSIIINYVVGDWKDTHQLY
jgi:hypothetical protein